MGNFTIIATRRDTLNVNDVLNASTPRKRHCTIKYHERRYFTRIISRVKRCLLRKRSNVLFNSNLGGPHGCVLTGGNVGDVKSHVPSLRFIRIDFNDITSFSPIRFVSLRICWKKTRTRMRNVPLTLKCEDGREIEI